MKVVYYIELILLFFIVQTLPQKLDAHSPKKYHISFSCIPFKGHFNQLVYLAALLNQRGHRVTFTLPNKYDNWVNEVNEIQHTIITYIPVGNCPSDSDYSKTIEGVDFQGFMTFLQMIYDYEDCMFEQILQVWKQDPPDIVVADAITVAAFDVADALNLTSVFEVPLWYPRLASGNGIEMTWVGRIKNFFITISGKIITGIIVDHVTKFRAKHGIRPWSSVGYWGNDVVTSMNAAIGFEYAYPICPNFKLFGPLAIPPIVAPLTTDLHTWINTSDNVIYVSLGTFASLNHEFLLKVVEGLSKTGFPVLWSLEDKLQKMLPELNQYIKSSFKVESDVPQHAVLKHPNVKGFLSNCGSSALESLNYGVPMVCIPYSTDSPDNCVRVRDSGSGICVDKRTFTSDEITTTLQTIITNSTFRQSAQRISHLFKEAGGIVKAADTIESIIENGYKHLICNSATLDVIQLYNLDIYGFLLVSIALPVFVGWRIISWCCRKKNNSSDSKQKQKRQ